MARLPPTYFFGLITNIFSEVYSIKHSQILNSMFLLLLDLFLVTEFHSWISSNLQKEWGLEFCLFFKNWGEVGKLVEE